MSNIQTAYSVSAFTMKYDIEMNNCGYHRGIKNNINVNRPKGRPDHHIIFVVSGTLIAELDNISYTVNSGEILYIPNEVPHSYQYMVTDETVYYWLHFCGTRANEITNEFGFKGGSYSIPKINRYTEKIDLMLREIQQDTVGCTLLCHAITWQILVQVAQDITSPEKTELYPNQNKILSIVARIRRNPEEEISSSIYAKDCDLSEYYFIRLFKKETGMPPHRFRMHMLMEKAKALLLDTDLYIEEIASLLKIEDPLYFSRSFKKQVGISPKNYRNKIRR